MVPPHQQLPLPLFAVDPDKPQNPHGTNYNILWRSEDAELTTDLYRLTSYLRGMCSHEWVEGQEFETPSAKGTYT